MPLQATSPDPKLSLFHFYCCSCVLRCEQTRMKREEKVDQLLTYQKGNYNQIIALQHIYIYTHTYIGSISGPHLAPHTVNKRAAKTHKTNTTKTTSATNTGSIELISPKKLKQQFGNKRSGSIIGPPWPSKHWANMWPSCWPWGGPVIGSGFRPSILKKKSNNCWKYLFDCVHLVNKNQAPHFSLLET